MQQSFQGVHRRDALTALVYLCSTVSEQPGSRGDTQQKSSSKAAGQDDVPLHELRGLKNTREGVINIDFCYYPHNDVVKAELWNTPPKSVTV